MHLEGPWLSTTGKRKGKKKFASAEHAKKARELEESWKELLKRQGVEQEERKRARGMSAPS
jgi:N-acetylglucosamine-6-phosphate deacetylase